ncbi:MAG: hypothetical protein K1Y02_22365 [Candidatus Hydrogenedentes bacterium]|nr:hypothetical protein [Candidatus Hydrogenedentota bacterium]
MPNESRTTPSNSITYLLFAALIMAYGWGYRGTVGHEAGAMLPGALLGLAVCLASGRSDWYRRSVVAGLFGAAGWAWGGSLSYMEHTAYTMSDSFPDVYYGYSMLFFLGGLWAGIGGGILGLSLTEPRSVLERFARAFSVVCFFYFLAYLFFLVAPDYKDAYETFSIRTFHDSDWLSATFALVASGLYWLTCRKDRPASALFFWCAVAWWVGYLGLTKFGGLRLAPLHRSESWGGVVGILVVLLIYLHRRNNRAALMLSLYGILGGGLGFATAVFIRHPVALRLWPFTEQWPQWRIAEDSFGLIMGSAIALGVLRLLRGRLASPAEDTPRPPLDVFAAFALLLAINWVNFRRHAAPWIERSDHSDTAPLLGMSMNGWFVLGGALVSIPVLVGLLQYLRGSRQLVPQTAFGKSAIVMLLLVWGTVAGYSFHDTPSASSMPGHFLLWIPAFAATMLFMTYVTRAAHSTGTIEDPVSCSDRRWNVGVKYILGWCLVPLCILAMTGASVAIQDGPAGGMPRKRFGPDAYWRLTARLLGTWRVAGIADTLGGNAEVQKDLSVTAFSFAPDRVVTVSTSEGASETTQQWMQKDQYTWLKWRLNETDPPRYAEIPLQFRDRRLFIAWPPDSQSGGYLVLEREGE